MVTAITRRTETRIKDANVIKQQVTQIGKMKYVVNSIFNRDMDITDNIRYLINK